MSECDHPNLVVITTRVQKDMLIRNPKYDGFLNHFSIERAKEPNSVFARCKDCGMTIKRSAKRAPKWLRSYIDDLNRNRHESSCETESEEL